MGLWDYWTKPKPNPSLAFSSEACCKLSRSIQLYWFFESIRFKGSKSTLSLSRWLESDQKLKTTEASAFNLAILHFWKIRWPTGTKVITTIQDNTGRYRGPGFWATVLHLINAWQVRRSIRLPNFQDTVISDALWIDYYQNGKLQFY